MNQKELEELKEAVLYLKKRESWVFFEKKYTSDTKGEAKSFSNASSIKLTISKNYFRQGEAFDFLMDIIYDYSSSLYECITKFSLIDSLDVRSFFKYSREKWNEDRLGSMELCCGISRFDTPELNDKQRSELAIKRNEDFIDKASGIFGILESCSKVYSKVHKYLQENHKDLLKKIYDTALEENYKDIYLGLLLIEESVKN